MACKDCGHMTPEEKAARKTQGDAVTGFATVIYGSCPKCTPKKLHPTIEQIYQVRIDSGREWDVKMADKKKAYINKKAASLEKKALRIYNSKRPAGYEEITDVSKL